MDYAEARRQLEKRHKESYDTRQDSGMFHDIFITDLPEGFNKWKCKEGEHLLDIVPFRVGSKHPKLPKGAIDYKMDVFVHTNIGPRKQEFICLARTFNQPCPICEYQDKLRLEDADDKTIKRFNPVRRVIYNIICYDSPQEEAKGIQVWYIAHFFTEQKLAGISKRPKGGGMVYFADLEVGKQVAFERQGTGRDNTSYLSHQFIDRESPLPVSLLDQTYQLDELLHYPTYEEIKEALFATAEAGIEDSDRNGGEAEASAPEVTEPETPAVEQPQVEQETKPTLPPPAQDIPVDEKVCPHGYRYGKDNEEYDECNGCPKWEPCADEAVVLAQKKVAKHEAGQQPATTPDKPELALRRRGS